MMNIAFILRQFEFPILVIDPVNIALSSKAEIIDLVISNFFYFYSLLFKNRFVRYPRSTISNIQIASALLNFNKMFFVNLASQ